MSDGSTTTNKKSRSTSDAERRQRRAQRILSSADSRLRKITSTYSNSLNAEPASTGASPFTSRKSSPLPSPVASEAPESPFATRRNTGNLEPLPEYLRPTTPSPN
ncbi:6294_t:CDS:2, partial [Acaulospora morrowiae]